jgi:hypothetical protein
MGVVEVFTRVFLPSNDADISASSPDAGVFSDVSDFADSVFRAFVDAGAGANAVFGARAGAHISAGTVADVDDGAQPGTESDAEADAVARGFAVAATADVGADAWHILELMSMLVLMLVLMHDATVSCATTVLMLLPMSGLVLEVILF